jgi:dipeptidyl aminopeptidase/acylaminoacyl peptidase
MITGEKNSTTTMEIMDQPMARLAGLRINTKTRCKMQSMYYKAFTINSISEDLSIKSVTVDVPPDSKMGAPTWTTDSKTILIGNTVNNGRELWAADAKTGRSHKVIGPVLSDVMTDLYQHTTNPREFLIFLRNGFEEFLADPKYRNLNLKRKSVSSNHKKASAKKKTGHKSRRKLSPSTQQTGKKASAGRTWQDLLQSPKDAKLFKFLATVQMAIVNIDSGKLRLIQKPGLYHSQSFSEDGKWLLAKELREPFSYSVPVTRFARNIIVINMTTGEKQNIKSQPIADAIPPDGIRTGIHGIRWLPHSDNTLLWTEALDDGDPEKTVPHRDKVMILSAPFKDIPKELFRTKDRCYSIAFTEKKGLIFPCEYDWKKRWIRISMRQIFGKSGYWPYLSNSSIGVTGDAHGNIDCNGGGNGAKTPSGEMSQEVFSYSSNDGYNAPGNFVETLSPTGYSQTIIEETPSGGVVYLFGDGETPDGSKPFLRTLNLTNFKTEEIFRCGEGCYESFNGFLNLPDGERTIVTAWQTPRVPQNYVFRRLNSIGEKHFISSRVSPSIRLKKIKKQLIKYERSDGTPLSALLCLPPDYSEDEKNLPENKRRPVIIWAYPRSYSGKDTAGQIRGSDNVYTLPSPLSIQMLLFEGYIVLDKTQIPVIGDPMTMNDTFIEQISESAKAAIDKLKEMKLINPEKVAIGGHSYGAFMAANLLAHTDLFAAGIGRSGAYNRTLTPFGFQAERRNLWEAKSTYMEMSPFLHADKIKEPFLMIHGQVDSNSGTFPIQSERMFQAIKGLGGTARLVILPRESHAYKARESILHTIAETVNWFDKYVKNRPEKTD